MTSLFSAGLSAECCRGISNNGWLNPLHGICCCTGRMSWDLPDSPRFIPKTPAAQGRPNGACAFFV
jgi:hypothetical protein